MAGAGVSWLQGAAVILARHPKRSEHLRLRWLCLSSMRPTMSVDLQVGGKGSYRSPSLSMSRNASGWSLTFNLLASGTTGSKFLTTSRGTAR
jgi:hypothetical protein